MPMVVTNVKMDTSKGIIPRHVNLARSSLIAEHARTSLVVVHVILVTTMRTLRGHTREVASLVMLMVYRLVLAQILEGN